MSSGPERLYPARDAALGGLLQRGPDTFFVEEILPFRPSGVGEHVFLQIEKAGLNTEEVVRRIARHAKVQPRDIGFAGLKDRHARTRQFFTVSLPGKTEPDWSALEDRELRILQCSRHDRKLRRGVHLGNRFRLSLMVQYGSREDWEAALSQLGQRGFPNYFGAQRFGYGNLAAAARLLAGTGRRPQRGQVGLLWSTARSALFNAVLAERVRDGSWQQLLPGERVQLEGSHSHFVASPEGADWPSLEARLCAWDLHPSGPLAGAGTDGPVGEAARAEQAALAAWVGPPEFAENGLVWADRLAGQGLRAARRALRCRTQDSSWQWRDATKLEIEFFLPAGSFATVCLEALGVQTQG
ncbi:MAG: tRNA pseudouridine(13) synthase TruD [Acidithiobacillus sp.]